MKYHATYLYARTIEDMVVVVVQLCSFYIVPISRNKRVIAASKQKHNSVVWPHQKLSLLRKSETKSPFKFQVFHCERQIKGASLKYQTEKGKRGTKTLSQFKKVNMHAS